MSQQKSKASKPKTKVKSDKSDKPDLSDVHLTAQQARAELEILMQHAPEIHSVNCPGMPVKDFAEVIYHAIESLPDERLIEGLYARHIWRETH